MSRPQVIVDVDGVLNTLIKDTLDAYTISTGKTLDYNSLTTYHIEDSLSPDDAAVIRQIWENKYFWRNLHTAEGVVQTLQDMVYDGDEIRIVTAITPDLFELRVGWLQHHFPFIDPANIVCCTRKEWVKGDFIIEDSIANLVRHDAYRICMNQPWNNRGAEYDDVHLIKRVNTLAEARAYINAVWKEIE